MGAFEEFSPIVGRPLALAPDLSLVLAPNPSPMTNLGTNTFLLGQETLAIIDPGPDNPVHLRALLQAIKERPVSHIFVTHSHLDHSPLARSLSDRTHAPIFAFGDSTAGRSKMMACLTQEGLIGGGEGVDHDFRPDCLLSDGQTVTEEWGKIVALHTPGHMGNHLCFKWKNAVFSGDHVMGWASSLVSPPDGDLTDFMASCAKLQALDVKVFYPAHGAPVTDPKTRLAWLVGHRQNRENQILTALAKHSKTPQVLTSDIYKDTPANLRAAAERNVFAHLVDLLQRKKIAVRGPLAIDAYFYKTGAK
ncbi:MAG: glyoxylase-like metal-dependent hydrolase (beta-lactamase superfamily II) [Yoonia sp.]|jgi:glyoxylase-like metal-dependent hydrolase (beta-lactamase superfamily II)